MKFKIIKLKDILPTRFSSEALEKIAARNRKGNPKKPLRFC